MVPISVSMIEGATLTAWPALRIAHDGAWIWRFAQGHTKRANSIQMLDPSDGDHAELRLVRLAALSQKFGIAPVVRVTPLTPPEVVEVLDGLGWDEVEPSDVMAMEMPHADFPVDVTSRDFDPDDPEWLKAMAHMSGYDPEKTETQRQIMSLIACPARGFLAYHKAGLPVAATLVGVSSGIGIYLNVVTHPSARGNGYGRAVMGAALNWARSQGAAYSALQVTSANQVAQSLYASLGFGEVYNYSYRRMPGWVSE